MSLLSTSADHTHTLTPEKDGPLHVTRRCFGIGICRNIAPELFGEVGAESGTTGAGASGRPGSYEGTVNLRVQRSDLCRIGTGRSAYGDRIPSRKRTGPQQSVVNRF